MFRLKKLLNLFKEIEEKQNEQNESCQQKCQELFKQAYKSFFPKNLNCHSVCIGVVIVLILLVVELAVEYMNPKKAPEIKAVLLTLAILVSVYCVAMMIVIVIRWKY